MISIIVYGRNDNHGYNLHKRVAISLNCFSEAIKHLPGAEIIFVDWSTDRRMSPLLISIFDLLSESAKSLCSVVLVSPDVATRYLPTASYLHRVEPIARNLGTLHAKNNWLLHTTTDIILSPKSSQLLFSLPNLDPGYYALPRFELPEAFWEYLPRSSPQEVIRLVNELADIYNLRLPVLSSKTNLFDAPGDFQLVDRETFIGVGGFDETMTKGWHVDSNFALRCCRHLCKEPNASLTSSIEIFHMNHNRKSTQVASNITTSNSLSTYITNVRFSDWRIERLPSKVYSDLLYAETSVQELRHLHATTYGSLLKPNRCQNQTNPPLDPRNQEQTCFFDDTLFAGLTEALNPLPTGSRIHVCSLHQHQLVKDLSDISLPSTHSIFTTPSLPAADPPATLLILDLRPTEPISDTAQFIRHLKPVFRSAASFLHETQNRGIIQVTLINCDSNYFDYIFSHHISLSRNMYYLRCKTGVYTHTVNQPLLSTPFIILSVLVLDFITKSKSTLSRTYPSPFTKCFNFLLRQVLFSSPLTEPLRVIFYRSLRAGTLIQKLDVLARWS